MMSHGLAHDIRISVEIDCSKNWKEYQWKHKFWFRVSCLGEIKLISDIHINGVVDGRWHRRVDNAYILRESIQNSTRIIHAKKSH